MSSPRLLQERYAGDPWKLLVSCVLLNCTTRRQVDGVIDELFDKWPSAEDMLYANWEDVREVITTLGMQSRRSQVLVELSRWWVTYQHSSDISTSIQLMEPPGIGEYARDSYMLFVDGPNERNVEFALRHPEWPRDKELSRWFEGIRYHATMGPEADREDSMRSGWAWRLKGDPDDDARREDDGDDRA